MSLSHLFSFPYLPLPYYHLFINFYLQHFLQQLKNLFPQLLTLILHLINFAIIFSIYSLCHLLFFSSHSCYHSHPTFFFLTLSANPAINPSPSGDWHMNRFVHNPIVLLPLLAAHKQLLAVSHPSIPPHR